MSQKQQVIKDSSLYISSNYVAQILGVIISVSMKRFMGPAMIGVWQLLHVIMGYCTYATLGTSKAAFREIPYHRGRQEWDQAERVKNEVFTFTLIMSLIPAIGIGIYALMTQETQSHYMFVGLLFVSFLVVFQRIYDYYTTLLRANKEFGIIARVTILSAVLNFIFVFILVKPFKIYGLLTATFLSVVVGYLYVYLKTRYAFLLTLSKRGVLKLLNIGVPLVLTGICFQTIRSLDKIIIAKELGMVALGNYSIAMMVHQYIVGVPNMLAIVLYPRLQEKFGELGSAEAIKNYLIYPVLSVALLTAFLAGVSVFVLPPLVNWVLPGFGQGIMAMKIFLAATFFFAIGQQASTFLVTLDKQWKMIPIYGLGIILLLVCASLAAERGLGIEGIALSVVVSAFVYNLILIVYAQYQITKTYKIHSFVLVTLGLFVYFFIMIGLLDQWQEATWYHLSLKMIIFLLGSVPPALYVNQQTGVFTNIKSFVVGKLRKS